MLKLALHRSLLLALIGCYLVLAAPQNLDRFGDGPRQVGESCDRKHACDTSLYCDNLICRKLKTNGMQCAKNRQCAMGACFTNVCLSYADRPAGAPCTLDKNCDETTFCSRGLLTPRCKAKKAVDLKCNRDSVCITSKCNLSTGRCAKPSQDEINATFSAAAVNALQQVQPVKDSAQYTDGPLAGLGQGAVKTTGNVSVQTINGKAVVVSVTDDKNPTVLQLQLASPISRRSASFVGVRAVTASQATLTMTTSSIANNSLSSGCQTMMSVNNFPPIPAQKLNTGLFGATTSIPDNGSGTVSFVSVSTVCQTGSKTTIQIQGMSISINQPSTTLSVPTVSPKSATSFTPTTTRTSTSSTVTGVQSYSPVPTYIPLLVNSTCSGIPNCGFEDQAPSLMFAPNWYPDKTANCGKEIGADPRSVYKGMQALFCLTSSNGPTNVRVALTSTNKTVYSMAFYAQYSFAQGGKSPGFHCNVISASNRSQTLFDDVCIPVGLTDPLWGWQQFQARYTAPDNGGVIFTLSFVGADIFRWDEVTVSPAVQFANVPVVID